MDSAYLHPVLREMPADWPVVRIADLFTIQQGKQVSETTRSGDRQRQFLRTKNVYWGRLDLAELDSMHFSEEDELRLRLAQGDLLTCEGGWVGRTAIWNGEVPDCLYQNHLHRLRRISVDTVPAFVLYWLWYAFEIGAVYFGRENVTTIPNLSKSRLGQLPMPSPSASEQRKIATVLSAVQRAIERQERLIALTAELKKALMHKLFTQGIRGEALQQTDKGVLPRSWSLRRFSEVFECFDGDRVPVKQSDRIPGPYPYYGASGIVDHVNDFRFDGEFLLIAEDGENLESRKLPIAFIASGKFWVNNHAHVVKNRVGDLRFFAYYISQMAIADYLSGTTRPKLNHAQMMSIPLPCPPEQEQREIANLLSTTDRKMDLHTRTHASLTALFRALLHQLMTARVRVPDLDPSAFKAEHERAGEV